MVLLILACLVTALRCWIRLRLEHRQLTASDYLVWCGWFCAVGWVVCSVKTLTLEIDNPPQGQHILTDSVTYLKVNRPHVCRECHPLNWRFARYSTNAILCHLRLSSLRITSSTLASSSQRHPLSRSICGWFHKVSQTCG